MDHIAIMATPLYYAVKGGHIDTVRYLLIEHNARLNIKSKKGCTTLHMAAHIGNVDIFNLLIEYGADIHDKMNDHNFTVMHVAACEGNVNMLRLLIERYECDVNPINKRNITPLALAQYKNHTKAIALLIQHDARVYRSMWDE